MNKDSAKTTTRTIAVSDLSRVEGEGGLYIRVNNNQVSDVQLKIFEPPRFFEGFLQGRDFTEAPDLTARICGICPVAYQMSSCHAMEDAYGVKVDGPLRELRRLLYCGEWIESHALHVLMLHAPDFLGYDSVIEMAKDFPTVVEQGMTLKKIGNEILELLGGRATHPINIKVGGFYKLPDKKQIKALKPKLERALKIAQIVAHWVAGFSFPDFEKDYRFVSLYHPDEYPFNEGDIASSDGLKIPLSKYNDHFKEQHAEHTTALQSVIIDGNAEYHVGPLARYALNYDKLTPLARKCAEELSLPKVVKNPFKSIIVRSIENIFACEEALRVVESYVEADAPAVRVEPPQKDADKERFIGFGCTEAPRGSLFHRYELDAKGQILKAQIVPPTSQNQLVIESDLKQFVEENLNLSDEDLTYQCEQAIRNYDPCISCSVHFLKLTIERS